MNAVDLTNTEERLLGRILRRQAETIPDVDFLIEDREHYSYGRVNELANSCAAGFAKAGVERGDTVTFFMNSCPDYAFATLGLNKMGGVWVPTNTDYKGTWLRESLEDSRARVLVADADLLPKLETLGEGLPFERILVRGELPADNALGIPLEPLAAFYDLPPTEPNDTDLHYGDTASILWTSGTTGRSKGVMQSHNVWVRGASAGAVNAGLRKGDILYNCLPMYQSASWVANIFRAMVSGVPCGLDPVFSASEFWDRCRHYDASMIFTLGAMHIFLWNAPPKPDDAKNPVRVASMIPMPADIEEPFKERFGIEAIFQGYGQSEVMTLTARTPGKTWKPNCLGDVQPGIEARLLDDEDLEVPVGETGELCVRPTEPFTVFNGYYNNPEATVKAFRNLWYHTGDLARRDEDGDYFFVDRKQDFIRYKGRNISSFAVEAAVSGHPDVAEVAAHGVTSAELEAEAELKVVVVCKPGTQPTPEDLARFVNDTAPYFFVPRYIEFVDELPHTPTGRVQKYKLRERGVTDATWDGKAAGFKIDR